MGWEIEQKAGDEGVRQSAPQGDERGAEGRREEGGGEGEHDSEVGVGFHEQQDRGAEEGQEAGGSERNLNDANANHIVHISLVGFLDHAHEQGLAGVGVDPQLQSQHLSLHFLPAVRLRSEHAVRVVHVIELEKLLHQQEQLLPVLLVEEGLALDVFPMEGRSLNEMGGTFLSESGSSTTLKTLERIWARMLERQPLASRVWMTKFLS